MWFCFIASGGSVGNDPHFFIPLSNGDNLCYSVQGQPDFMFNLIKDKFVQLNAQFVLPAGDESNTIANVSTFLGNLGLLLRSPTTSRVIAIEVSAEHHNVKVSDQVVLLQDKPITITVSNNFNITTNIHSEVLDKLKDETAWLHIISEFGFALKVKFYKKHLDMMITKSRGLTNNAHGLIGK